MRTARLEQLCDINPRAPKDLDDAATAAFLPMAAVSEDGAIAYSEARPVAEVKKGYTYFERGDVLVAKITPCFENGKATRTSQLEHPFGFGSTEFHVLRPSSELCPDYLFHMVWNPFFRATGTRNMTGSAGQKRVPADFLKRYEIPLPPLPEQRRIAAILDKADALRRKRRQALDLLDSLTQSIFLEMFGDPATNPFGFERKTFGQIATKMSDGPFGSNLKSEHYVVEGVRVIRLQNIGLGKFVDDDRAYITTSHFRSLRKHECLPGDVLVGTLGDPNLRACVQPQWLTRALNKADCVQIRVNEQLALPEYLAALINQPSTERMAQGITLGQTRSRISMGRLRNMAVPIAPVERQRSYIETVQLIRAQSQNLMKATKMHSDLFNSLQSRAFSGQL